MEASTADWIGQTIAGRYRLLRLVGEGGVGSVYEAEQSLGSASRAVAVKLLRPEWSNDAAVKARFQREAALVARLQHPNTVRIYDFGVTEDGTLFIAMEFLRGRTLQQLLDEQGAQPAARVQRIVAQVAASLEEAHELGIVHRDLKPDNILILDSPGAEVDSVKLLDFGIAKGQPAASSAVTKLTALGTFVGTPAYMSPEQFGGGSVGVESDVYALGVTSYQLLARRLPFEAQSPLEWARAHLGTPAPPLAADHGAGLIPEAMRQAVARALAKDPSQRPASAAQFARELAASAPPRHTAPMTQVPEPEPSRRAGVAPTLPDAASAVRAAPPAAPGSLSAPRSRFALVALLVAVVGSSLAGIAVYGERFGVWSRWRQAAEPAGSGLAAPAESVAPAPVVIEPEPPVALAPSRPPASEPVVPPARGGTPARPAPPAPRPAPAPPATVPGLPPLPTVATPPARPAPPPALPAPGPSAPPGLPLPWQLPTQGACERCLEALRAGGHGSVVSAATENLLCDDRAGRERCEGQMREAAPGVAEQAARAGDCAAALATEAAAVHLGVDQQRFQSVNALCVR